MKKDSYYTGLEKEGYYNTLDKRSKDYREYKEWRATKQSDSYNKLKQNVENQSEGVGDTVAKITKATGIEKLVKFVAGEDCGCDDRKDKLNKLFNYKQIKCIPEDDYNYLTNLFSYGKSVVTNEEKIKLITIYNYLFSKKQPTRTSCSPCIAGIVNKLKKYLEVYK